MADDVFNIAKGRQVQFAMLTGANDGLKCVVLETAGIEARSTLVDYDNLSALLAGSSNEQTTMGRKDITSVVVTIDDTNDFTWVDCDDIVWTAATGNPISALVFNYKPDLGVTDDTVMIPLTVHDFVATPNGSDITAQIATTGFTKAS